MPPTMINFVLYLFESGLCLSLLYLAYWLLLKNETYFNFNRMFLVGSIILALLVPALHLNFAVKQEGRISETAIGIVKFRSYYEELISMIEADFGTEPGVGNFPEMGVKQTLDNDNYFSNIPSLAEEQINIQKGNSGKMEGSKIPLSTVLLLIYIGGVLYFFVRFIYLVIRLLLLAKRNGFTQHKGYRMVEIKEDISPFSFFRFLFINKDLFNTSEFDNVLAHEKVHIAQKHTIDHLFAHGIAVFQWFNPFAWQMRNALKTTHEYIADRQVIDIGFELFDYQSILLRQVIGYHSVELVNNFNLKPIKKRIIMMTKNKPGLPAKFKATLVIPFAIAAFLLFADFTLKESDANPNTTLRPLSDIINEKDLKGLWIKDCDADFSEYLHFADGIFSFAGNSEIRSYFWSVAQGRLLLNKRLESTPQYLKIELKGKELTLWWNEHRSCKYIKSDANNTLDLFLMEQGLDIRPPEISNFRILEERELTNRICIAQKGNSDHTLTFNGESIQLDQLASKVIYEREQKDILLDAANHVNMFIVDRDIQMTEVLKVREVLREIGSLSIADAGYPKAYRNIPEVDNVYTSGLLYDRIAIPRKLPPLNAMMLDEEKLRAEGHLLHVIDLSLRNSNPQQVHKELLAFIGNAQGRNYVLSLKYDGEIPYGEYIEVVDMIYRVIYEYRDELSMKKYNSAYEKLGPALQKEIRSLYPLALSESLLD